MKFNQISDELVEVIDDYGTSTVLSLSEANQLGYSIFTYQGRPVSIAEFARTIDETDAKIYNIAYKTGYRTGEEIIQFIKEQEETKREFTYKGEKVGIANFARLIDKNKSTIYAIICNNGYKTGEEVLQYLQTNPLQSKPKKRKLTYQRKEITLAEFANTIGKSKNAIANLMRKYSFNTGEEILEYYNQPYNRHYNQYKKYTLNGKHITLQVFAKQLGRSSSAIIKIMQQYGYSTCDEVLNHYKMKGQL